MAKSSTTGASLPFDPSANVTDLVDAEGKYQDGMREAEVRRQNDLRKMDHRFSGKLRRAESKRVDAESRAEKSRVDALFAKQESDAAILEQRTSTQALALSDNVASTAKAFADQTSLLRDAIDKRLSEIERRQYSGSGVSEGEDKVKTRATITQNQLIGVGVLLLAAFTYLHSIRVL